MYIRNISAKFCLPHRISQCDLYMRNISYLGKNMFTFRYLKIVKDLGNYHRNNLVIDIFLYCLELELDQHFVLTSVEDFMMVVNLNCSSETKFQKILKIFSIVLSIIQNIYQINNSFHLNPVFLKLIYFIFIFITPAPL